MSVTLIMILAAVLALVVLTMWLRPRLIVIRTTGEEDSLASLAQTAHEFSRSIQWAIRKNDDNCALKLTAELSRVVNKIGLHYGESKPLYLGEAEGLLKQWDQGGSWNELSPIMVNVEINLKLLRDQVVVAHQPQT